MTLSGKKVTKKTLLFAIFVLAAAVSSIVFISRELQDRENQQFSVISQALAEPQSLTFLSINGNQIINEKGDTIKLRGFHYDCFYVIRKDLYDSIKLNNKDPEQFNIELMEYYFTEKDINEIKATGANVVRIAFRLWEIEKTPYSYSKRALEHLDKTIARWGENGIYVILDLHAAGQNSIDHNKEYGNIIWDDKDFQDRVIALWGLIASRYKNNKYVAGYDIINEPQAPNINALNSFYKKTIEKIRGTDKKHILFIELNLYNAGEILFGGEYNDDNTAFSLHFYIPIEFTYQGMESRQIGYQYPGEYGDVYWDKNQINGYFEKIIKKTKNRPLFVGEFNASVWNGGEYAFQWIRDVIDVFNSKGIHYTFFQYKTFMPKTFGYYSPSEEAFEKIKILQHAVGYKGKVFNEFTEEEKNLLLTGNFESPPGLRNILIQGLRTTPQ